MTNRKILIPLYEEDVAPRFDLTTDVLIVKGESGGGIAEERTLILAQASSEKLCHLILTEGVHVVICGGIEEEYHDYLIWKKIQVVDNIIGDSRAAVKRFLSGTLKQGDILISRA